MTNRKPKLLFVSHCFPMGPDDSRGNFFIDLLVELHRMQIDVGVLAPIWQSDQKFNWEFDNFCFTLHRPFLSQKQSNVSKIKTIFLFYFKVLISLILNRQRIKNYDKVIFCWGFPSGLLSRLFSNSSSKVVWWLGTDFQLAKDHVILYSNIIGRNVTHVSCSLSIREKLAADISNVRHWPISYSKTSGKDKNELGVQSAKIKFIAVGRLEKIKQFDKLIECFLRLDKNTYSLKIVGEGTQSEELRNSVKTHSNITFLGKLNRYETIEMMRQSDCLIVSSLHEGLPTVFFEGLEVGLPCISLAVGDIAHLLPKFPSVGYLMKRLSVHEIEYGWNKVQRIKQPEFDAQAKKILENYSYTKTVEELIYE